MGNLNKVVYTDHQTVITASNLNDIQDSVIQNTSYVTCSTASNTAAKTAALTNFVLTTGSAVKVKFTNTNTAANPTLNINSTGAKPIMQYGTTVAGTTATESWDDGAVVEFVYDGTNWVMQGRNTIDAVSKSGGTFTGDVTIDKNRTGTNLEISVLTLGNDIPNGTAGNSYGVVRLYGKTNQYTNLSASESTATRGISLPDESGTIALTNNPTDITVDKADGTTSAQGWSSVLIGNNKATGTAGNSAGDLQIYGRTAYKTEFISPPNSPTANRVITIPDASGTLALTDDVGFINKGHISIGGALTDIENWIKSNFASNRWVVARVTPTSSGYFGSSSFDIMANCSSANYGWGYCHSDNPTADGHLYFRLGAGQFFWKKVMMCPADSAATGTITAASGWTVSYSRLAKYGHVVTVTFNVSGGTLSTTGWNIVGTIPSGFRPPYAIDFCGIDNVNCNSFQAQISGGGNINIYKAGGQTINNNVRLHVSYIVD